MSIVNKKILEAEPISSNSSVLFSKTHEQSNKQFYTKAFDWIAELQNY